MSLGAHLLEFRNRVLIAAAALLVGMIVAFFVTDWVIGFIMGPINDVAENRADLVTLTFNSVTEPFDLRMRMAFAIGIFLSAPIWIWQIWAFIMPGLTRKEIKYTWGFLGAAIPLFFAGCYVAMLVFPNIIVLMASFTPDGAANTYGARFYYDFVFKLMLTVGVAFVAPVAMVLLNFIGVLSGKAILKGWRVAILVATLFAAITTPAADVVSMLMLGGILVVLYFGAAGVCLLFDRLRRKKRIAEGLEPDLTA